MHLCVFCNLADSSSVKTNQVTMIFTPISTYFYPLKFFICSDFVAEVQWSENYRDQNLPLRNCQPEKTLPKILADPFRVKILGGADKHKILQQCSENSRSQIVFRTDISGKLTLGAPESIQLIIAKLADETAGKRKLAWLNGRIIMVFKYIKMI